MVRVKSWFPVLLWATLIFSFSSIKVSALPHVNIYHIDKIAHFLEFFIFAVLLSSALKETSPRWFPVKILVISAIIASLYGLMDEYHQSFVLYRTPDFFDFVSDALGAIIGAVVFMNRTKKGIRRDAGDKTI